MANAFLTIKNLTKTYNPDTPGVVVAIDELSFSVSEGEFITVVGSNAAGKTTLFNTIAGVILPTSGDIILESKSILNLPEHKRAGFIARVRQNPNDSIVTTMTLAENLTIAKLKGVKAGLAKGVKKEYREEFTTILKSLGLGLENRLDDKMSLLSGGQKQAVALLMATIVKPKLLLLDEHTASLDPKISKVILEITNKLVKENKVTTLMITHNIHHAIEYGNRLILLDKGKIKFEASGSKKLNLKIVDVVEHFESKTTELEEDITRLK